MSVKKLKVEDLRKFRPSRKASSSPTKGDPSVVSGDVTSRPNVSDRQMSTEKQKPNVKSRGRPRNSSSQDSQETNTMSDSSQNESGRNFRFHSYVIHSDHTLCRSKDLCSRHISEFG